MNNSKSYDELKAENERLKKWIDDLSSGMYINCVYCGHQYGPNNGPEIMSEVLKAHIEQCEHHPMYHLKLELSTLKNFILDKNFTNKNQIFGVRITQQDWACANGGDYDYTGTYEAMLMLVQHFEEEDKKFGHAPVIYEILPYSK